MNQHIPLIERLHRASFPAPPVVPFDLGYLNPLWRPEETKIEKAGAEEAKPAEALALPENLPAVIQAPEPQVSPFDQSRTLLSAAMVAVSGADVSGNEGLKGRAADLLSEFTGLTVRVGQFLSDARQAKIASLTAQHEQASAACREQEAVRDAIQLRYDEQFAKLRKLQGEKLSARNLLTACDGRKPTKWPTREEVAIWNAERARLAQAQEQAEDALARGQGDLAFVSAQLREANNKLAELDAAATILSKRLRGEPWSDPEFGLEHEPEL